MYTLLNEAIRNRGIRKSVIARKIGVTTNTLNNKIYGVTDFSWSECCAIQRYFSLTLTRIHCSRYPSERVERS